jgi:hypothetical protein
MAIATLGPKYIKCVGCNQIHEVLLEKSSSLVARLLPATQATNINITYYFVCPVLYNQNPELGQMEVDIKLRLDEQDYVNGKLSVNTIASAQQPNYMTLVEAVAIPLQQTNSVLIDFGKDIIKNSIDNIQKFDELMIPLTTGLITAYFAILAFLNIGTIQNIPQTNVINFEFVISPIYFLLASLVGFIVSTFPILQKLSLNSIDSIKKYRNHLLLWRYGCTAISSALYVTGFCQLIIVISTIVDKLSP